MERFANRPYFPPLKITNTFVRYDRFSHHRKSIRLKGWDYTRPGIYYITMCTKDRVCLFGEIKNNKMILDKYGRIVDKIWRELEEKYAYVQLDAYHIMPNHFHGIIIYKKWYDVICRGGSRTASTYGDLKSPNTQIKQRRKSLGRLIGAFKTMTTKQINIIYQT
jgi:putative transposase